MVCGHMHGVGVQLTVYIKQTSRVIRPHTSIYPDTLATLGEFTSAAYCMHAVFSVTVFRHMPN